MAIIDARGGGGFGILIETLLNKEKLEQAERAQKMEKDRFKMEQERFQFEQAQAQASQEAGASLLALLGPQAQSAAQGLSPAAQAAFAPQALAVQAQQAQIGESQARIRGIDADIANLDRLNSLRTRELDLMERGQNIDQSVALQQIAAERQGRREALASSEFQNALSIAAALEIPPALFFEQGYGTDEVSPQTILERLDENPTIETTQRRRLTAFLAGLGVGDENRNTLNEALFVEGLAPQEVANQFFAEKDVEDETKATIFYVLNSVFGGDLRVPENAGPTFWPAFGKILQRSIHPSPEFQEAIKGIRQASFSPIILGNTPSR